MQQSKARIAKLTHRKFTRQSSPLPTRKRLLTALSDSLRMHKAKLKYARGHLSPTTLNMISSQQSQSVSELANIFFLCMWNGPLDSLLASSCSWQELIPAPRQCQNKDRILTHNSLSCSCQKCQKWESRLDPHTGEEGVSCNTPPTCRSQIAAGCCRP